MFVSSGDTILGNQGQTLFKGEKAPATFSFPLLARRLQRFVEPLQLVWCLQYILRDSVKISTELLVDHLKQ
jgi:hypothetical protein